MLRGRLALLGLVTLALGFASCGTEQSGEITDGQTLCSVPFPFYDHHYPRHFLNWSPDGARLIFDYGKSINVVDAEGTQVRELAIVDPSGSPAFSFYADMSPDGTRVVYSTCEFTRLRNGRLTHVYEIAAINLDGTGQGRLTDNSYTDGVPSWSPDGSHIAFVGSGRLYTMAADGSGIQQVVPVHKLREGSDETKEVREIHLAPPVWSPDGERLAFLVDEVVSRIGGRWVLYIVRTDGTELTRIAEAVVPPVWSPDGEFLTFVRASEIDESGEREEIGEHEKVIGIYTVRADGTDMRQLLAPQSAEWNVTQIALSPDGSELLIVSEQQALIIQADGTGLRSFELPGHPEAWRQVAWSPDGSRIAVFVSSDSTKRGPPQIYTVARDGSDRRDLIRVDDDGNLVPANPPEDE